MNNIVIFKWVLANSDEYHLLKWVLITPLSQSSVCKIHTWQALSGCEQSTWNTAILLEPVEFHRQNKTVHKLGSRPPSVQRWGRRRPSTLACSQCLALLYSNSLTTLNAWENTLRHDCGLHIAHVHKNPCGSRDFPNQALLFLNCTPISFFAASFCLFDEQWQQQEKVRPGNEASEAASLCVGQEGLYTSLKPERDLYDGPMVGMSELGSVQVMASLCASYGASNWCLWRQPDHKTIVEVDEPSFLASD